MCEIVTDRENTWRKDYKDEESQNEEKKAAWFRGRRTIHGASRVACVQDGAQDRYLKAAPVYELGNESQVIGSDLISTMFAINKYYGKTKSDV
jgi:hypothetical protein